MHNTVLIINGHLIKYLNYLQLLSDCQQFSIVLPHQFLKPPVGLGLILASFPVVSAHSNHPNESKIRLRYF